MAQPIWERINPMPYRWGWRDYLAVGILCGGVAAICIGLPALALWLASHPEYHP